MRLVAIALLLFGLQAGGRGQAGELTLRRINEYSAVCVAARDTMRGLKGGKLPGETPQRYRERIEGYLAALERAARALQPLRTPPHTRNSAAENTARWQAVAAAIPRLEEQTRAAREAWALVPKEGDKARLGPRLLEALTTLQEILSNLRDARP